LCGQGGDWNESIINLEVKVAHSAPEVSIEFSSTLNEAATNESWGIRDFHLLRNQVWDGEEGCAILYEECDYQGKKA